MASLLSRLIARFNKNQQNRDRRKVRNRGRSLRVESMESRRLLAGDIGAIAGNVFTDLTDNGLDASDTAIVGTSVHLYRDGGNGTFDSGAGVAGGDDVLVGTTSSDGSGDYRFDDLIAATYFVEQASVSGQVQRSSETTKTVTLSETDVSGTLAANFDTFNDAVQQIVTANAGSPTVSDARDTAEAIGAERDVVVNHTSGGNNVEVDIDSGQMSISTGAGTAGNAIISYDGDDNDANTLAHTLGLDMTAGGGTSLHFLGGSQGVVNMTIDVYSGAGNQSTFSMVVPTTAGGTATENITIEFTDFSTAAGTGADFSSVSAVSIQIDMTAAADAEFDFSRIVAPTVNTQNFPNLNPMSVGNLVFGDTDNSGTFDGSETGIDGVTVQLYTDTNTNGSFDSGTDTLVGTTVTAGGGAYQFNNLLPGEYIALIPNSQFGTGQALENFATSTDPAPDPDITVVDGDDNGALIAGVGVATAAITLASGSEPTNDGDADTNTDFTVDFGMVPTVDVAVAKSANVSTLHAGEQVTYTLTVSNPGSNTATNVVVTDNLPDDFVIQSANATGGGTVVQTGNAAGEVTVTYSSLTAGQSETITIIATVPATRAAAAAITNTATVTSDGTDSNPTNNTATVDVAVTRNAVLTITKTDTPDPVPVGGALTYTILVTNTGPSTANNVSISDTIPAGLTVTNVTTTAGTAGESGGVVTGSVPTLAVSGSVTITISATVASGFAGTTITNTATAQADESQQVSANTDTTVNPQIDLAITKTDSVDPAIRGNQLTYTLAVSNNGPSAATNVEVVDTLPAGVTFVSATGGTVTAPSGGSNDVTVALGGLASGASQNVTITVTVDDAAAASITNSAIVRSTESTGGFDTDTSNNSATEPTAIESNIDLSITKTDSVDPVIAGQSFTYTLTVANAGPSAATGVTVTDVLPDGIQITSATSTAGTVTTPASAQDTTAANPDDLTVAIGNLASGASETITIVATVLPELRTSLSNTASVTTSDTGMNETNTANNTATEPTAVNASVDLAITKTDSTDPVIAGNALTYTLTVTNNGPSTATGVTVSDVLPAGVTFTSTSSSQGSSANSGGTVTASLGTIAPGANATVTIVVDVDEATRTSLSNTATVTSTETDSNTANNTATEPTTVNANIDLAVTKVDDIDPIAPGSTLQYTMVVTNNGPSQATGVTLNDTLPSGLTFVSATSTVGTATGAGNVVTGNIGTLASGASATVTVTATVDATASGTLTNTATVTGTETETNSTNNSATQTTDIAIPGSISGRVYLDQDGNGAFTSGESGLGGVTITLTGTAVGGAAVSRTETTAADGTYTFNNVLPGTYSLQQTQPTGVLDGQTNVGTGATGATAGTNEINTITLGNAPAAAEFNFGEILSPLSKRRFLASSGPTD
ncbi:MAG: SdrD B-like domain-containing protein [Aureliella sp.]